MRTRSRSSARVSPDRWLVSYADFVTLMFGFFLILWASASQDPVRFSELALAFKRAFNTGAMLGIFRENVEYINKYDAISAAGGGVLLRSNA